MVERKKWEGGREGGREPSGLEGVGGWGWKGRGVMGLVGFCRTEVR